MTPWTNKECLSFGPTLGAHPRHPRIRPEWNDSMRKLSTSAWRAAVQKMTGKKDVDAIENEGFYSTSSPVGDKGYSALCKWLLSTILDVYLLPLCCALRQKAEKWRLAWLRVCWSCEACGWWIVAWLIIRSCFMHRGRSETKRQILGAFGRRFRFYLIMERQIPLAYNWSFCLFFQRQTESRSKTSLNRTKSA